MKAKIKRANHRELDFEKMRQVLSRYVAGSTLLRVDTMQTGKRGNGALGVFQGMTGRKSDVLNLLVLREGKFRTWKIKLTEDLWLRVWELPATEVLTRFETLNKIGLDWTIPQARRPYVRQVPERL